MTPEQLGFDSRRLHRIADLTHRYVDEGKMPCVVVAVLRHGEEVYRDVYGQADMEHGTPVADDTVFRLFSMTKPITSIGLLQLVEQGRVQLDDHVSDYIPEFADTEVYVSGDAGGYETRPPVPWRSSISFGTPPVSATRSSSRIPSMTSTRTTGSAIGPRDPKPRGRHEGPGRDAACLLPR